MNVPSSEMVNRRGIVLYIVMFIYACKCYRMKL
jgi:hypothetical protein